MPFRGNRQHTKTLYSHNLLDLRDDYGLIARVRSSATYRLCITLFAALFLLVQGYGVAHAAGYGDAPHDHDEVTCVINVVASDHDCVLPPQLTADPLPILGLCAPLTPYIRAAVQIPPGRVPPPRGPPN